jgi:hypothetical protein
MGASLLIENALSKLASHARYSPFLTFFTICALYCLFTRIWTGYQNSRIQSNTTSPEKEIPIMPCWLPYLGHVPSFGWSFDNLLAKAPFVSSIHFQHDQLVTTNGDQSDTTKDGILGLSMMGTKHYIILMPSLTKSSSRKDLLCSPAIASSTGSPLEVGTLPTTPHS